MPITPSDFSGSYRGKILDWKTVTVSSNQATATFDLPVEYAWAQLVGTSAGSSVPAVSISGKTVTVKITASDGTAIHVFAVCTAQ